jgi:very-short-patch-repair endonuclease
MMGRKRWRQYRVLPDIAVIRFGNEQVVREPDAVLGEIARALGELVV